MIPVDPSISVDPRAKFAPAIQGSEGSYLLEIVFIDPCWLSELVPGQFTFSNREYDLYEFQ